MPAQWKTCGLVAALDALRPDSGYLGNMLIGLFVNDATLTVTDCDEDTFTEPTWDGYAKQVAKPWAAAEIPAGQEYARSNSALLEFPVNSDPGAEVIYGWFAYDDARPAGSRVAFCEKFDTPETPVEGEPFFLVARVILKNCEE